jgi:hypothetical protein
MAREREHNLIRNWVVKIQDPAKRSGFDLIRTPTLTKKQHKFLTAIEQCEKTRVLL